MTSRDDKVEIISKSTTQVGQVTVNFTVGRIKPTPKKPDDRPSMDEVMQEWVDFLNSSDGQ